MHHIHTVALHSVPVTDVGVQQRHAEIPVPLGRMIVMRSGPRPNRRQRAVDDGIVVGLHLDDASLVVRFTLLVLECLHIGRW